MVDASVDTEGKLVPVIRTGNEIRGVGCATALSWPVWYGEDYMDVDGAILHYKRIAAGTTITKKFDIVAVGICGSNFSVHARRCGQRDLLMGASTQYVILATGTDSHTALAHGGDVDSVGMLEGIAIQVVAAEAAEVIVKCIIIAKVICAVVIFECCFRRETSNPEIVLIMIVYACAIEHNMTDNSITLVLLS